MAKLTRPIKAALFAIVIIAIAGGVAAYFLFPTGEKAIELQQAAVNDKPVAPDPAAIKAQYESEFAAGTVSFATAQSYAQSLQNTNNLEGAVQIWRDYVSRAPDDLNGWKQLASFETAANHEEEYLAALTKIAKLEPNEENLKALSSYQNYKQKYEEQKETLKQLVIMTNEQNAEYIIALADVAMLANDKEAALSSYASYFNNAAFAAIRDNSKIEPYIRLLAQAGKKDEAVQQAILLTKDAKVAVAMTPQNSILTSIMEIAQATSDEVPQPPPPPAMVIAPDESSSATPDPVAADSALTPPPAPVADVPPAPPLSAASAEPEVAVSPAPESSIPTAADAVPAPPVPPSPIDAVPPAPVAPTTPIAVDATPPAPPAEANAVPQAPPVPIVQGEPVPTPETPATPLVSDAVPTPADAPPAVTPPVDPSVALSPPAVAASPADAAVPTDPAAAVVDAQAQTANQSAPEMVTDVELQARIADVILFEAGADYAVQYIQGVSTDGQIAEGLEVVYARAMAQQGKYAEALPILKKLSVKGGDYREWYFLALSSAAKKDKPARADLVQHVKESFEAEDLTEDQKIDRVYALLNAGERASALDYTERSMQAAGDAESKDKWQKLYRSLTVKPKAVAKSRTRAVPRVTLEQKLALANKTGATQDYMRRTAFEALASGKKAEAMNLFAQLASVNGPDSSDAQQLTYLWGARITGQELSWVIDRANSSTGAEQSGWINIVANGAAAEDIVSIGTAYPHWLTHPIFERRYANSLVQLRDTNGLGNYLANQASGQQSVEAYQTLAAQAGSVMDVSTQEQALRRAAEVEPYNRDVWLQLTSMYLSRARYSAAEQTLANAMHIDGSQYAVDQHTAVRQGLAMNYYAAALSRREGEYSKASQYFSQAVQQTGNEMFADRDSQVKLLSAQMALGDETHASQGFEVLLDSYPGDAGLLADYMNALLDRGSYLQALDVASRHGADVVLDAPAALENPQPVLIRAPNGEMPLIQSMSGGSELKLQFARPLPANYQVLNVVQNPAWVSYTTTSYDTALISAQSGYTLQANATTEGLLVSAVPTPDTTSSEAIRQRYLRLQLLYARLELETGSTDKALERLESLAPTYQEYPEYRAYQANTEYYAGNLKRGLNLIKRAQKGDPQNEDIAYLRRNIERFHAEHIRVDHEWQKVGDHRMNITTVEARKQFANSIEAYAQYQNNMIDTDFVQRANGAIQKVDSNRWRATFSLAKFMEDSSIIEASIYGNKETPGAGLSYQFVNPIGTTQAYLQYHKPYWDVVEAVVEDTTRDRVGAWHLWRPDPRWSVRVDAGYNRYNIDQKTNLAESVGVQATLLRTLWDKQPYVAGVYGFDGEYMLDDIKRGSTNAKYLPLRAREVHSLGAIVYQDFTQDTNGELNVGYAVDRLGEHGPSAEARLTHYVTDDVDVQLRARYGLEIQETENDALSIGGYVRWTW